MPGFTVFVQAPLVPFLENDQIFPLVPSCFPPCLHPFLFLPFYFTLFKPSPFAFVGSGPV